MSTPDANKQGTPEIDLDEVAKLLQALEQDLASVKGDAKDIQRLRDEVQTLKNVLISPVRRHHWVRDVAQHPACIRERAGHGRGRGPEGQSVHCGDRAHIGNVILSRLLLRQPGTSHWDNSIRVSGSPGPIARRVWKAVAPEPGEADERVDETRNRRCVHVG